MISGTQTETYIQLAIPYLPMWLAAICLIMNVLIPGTGKPEHALTIAYSAKKSFVAPVAAGRESAPVPHR